MSIKQLSPDDLAEAVRSLVEANGCCLTELSFDTQGGSHSYHPILVRSLEDRISKAIIAPHDSTE